MSKKNKIPPKDAVDNPQTHLLQQRKYSRLTPQAKNWEEDLPEKYDLQQSTPPQLIRVNEINDTWMEIPRYENIGWLGMWFTSIGSLFFITLNYFFFLLPNFFSGMKSDDKVHVLLLNFSMLSLFLFFIRMALFVPRGTPVRFNRKRQKVYVYEHQRSIWPWMRWPTVIKVFDWRDIYGELIQQSGRYDYGHRVSCAVCKPGTYDVVDRFILSWTVGDIRVARGLWNHCCLYMQYKPVPETPLLTRRPWSWTPFKNIRWPEEIDRESTTAPEPIGTDSQYRTITG